MSSSSGLTVTVWCPSFHGENGGVQQFSRLLLQGLQDSPRVRKCHTVTLRPGKQARCLFVLQAFAGLLFQRPDLLIVTHIHLARLYPLLHFLKIPYWICAHGIECWTPLQKAERNSMSKAERILCVSRYTRDQLQQHNPDLSLTTVLFPNHILPPPENLPTKEESRMRLLPTLPDPAFILLCVSRLASRERYKGHRQMLKALRALKKRGENVVFLIAGEGDDRTALESLSVTLDIDDRVFFLGRLDDETLELAYAACDAFAMPSTGEGFGIVYLEAMARGRPVLAGNRDGSIDALKDGTLGILVDPLNEESLILGLQQLRTAAEQNDPSKLRSAVLKEFGYHKLQERLDLLLHNHMKLCVA